MGDEHVLDLHRIDVLAAAHDPVPAPAGQVQVAVTVERPEVTGAEPAVGISHEQVRRPGHDLTDSVRPGALDAHLDTRRGPANRPQQLRPPAGGELMIRRGEARDRAALRLPEDVDEAHAGKRGHCRAERVGMDRRRPVLQRAQRRQGEGVVLEQDVDRRGHEKGVRDATPAEADPALDAEAAEREQRGAGAERHEQHAEAGDVVQRRRRGVDGAGAEFEQRGVDRDPGGEAILPVRDRLREPARARRVEDGGHGVGRHVQVERARRRRDHPGGAPPSGLCGPPPPSPDRRSRARRRGSAHPAAPRRRTTRPPSVSAPAVPRAGACSPRRWSARPRRPTSRAGRRPGCPPAQRRRRASPRPRPRAASAGRRSTPRRRR